MMWRMTAPAGGAPGSPLATPAHVAVLRARIAPARFDKYVIAAGGDPSAGLQLYQWNIAVSGALHEAISQLEVLLRNALDEQLRRYHGKVHSGGGDWYADLAVPLQADLRSQVAVARGRARKGGRPEVHGKVIAELTFGFWRYLLDARHQATLWAPALRHAFPHLRPRVRSQVYDRVERLHRLRNRVAHHEPLYGLPLEQAWRELVEVCGYVDPTTAAWVWSSSRLPAVLAQRP